MSEAMKPCPFCGADGVVCGVLSEFMAGCRDDDCVHFGEILFPTEAAAIAAWNTRAADDAHEALVECVTTMGHAEIFVNSRERIKQPEGADLYRECLDKARAALAKGRAG